MDTKEYTWKIIRKYLARAKETSSRVDNTECIRAIKVVEYILDHYSCGRWSRIDEREVLTNFNKKLYE